MTDTMAAPIYPRSSIREANPAAHLSRRTAGRLRRTTLVTLRWMAIIGQSLALIFVAVGLGYSFPIWPCAVIITISIALNVLISLSLPTDRRVSDKEAGAQLGFDLLQLAALLWLTGGMTNPFALLFVAPVVTSATTLSRSVFTLLSVMAAALSFGLLYSSQPLPWSPAGTFSLPYLFRLGIWFALMVAMVFTSIYAWRVASESRRMSEALAATEAVLAQEQKLAALGGLAAAAAHELGTPLATILLIAKEMAHELGPDTPHREDVQLMVSQTERCRDILKQLALRGDEGDIIHDHVTLEALLREAASPFEGLGTDINIVTHGEGSVPSLGRQAELLYGLKNLIENAIGFAHETVSITGNWTDTNILIAVEDDGPGFDPTVLNKLGEPYVSGREEKVEAGGLGLGFFIAKTLIERTGGTMKFGNRPQGGAFISLAWQRSDLTQD